MRDAWATVYTTPCVRHFGKWHCLSRKSARKVHVHVHVRVSRSLGAQESSCFKHSTRGRAHHTGWAETGRARRALPPSTSIVLVDPHTLKRSVGPHTSSCRRQRKSAAHTTSTSTPPPHRDPCPPIFFAKVEFIFSLSLYAPSSVDLT